MMNIIKIPNQQEEKGKQAFIYRGPILNEVCKIYGRDPLLTALKVFYGNPLEKGETLKDALWGDNHDPNDSNQVRRNTKLWDGTRIQNICWKEGKAPRIYALFEAEWEEKRVAVQLTEYLTGPNPKEMSEVTAKYEELNQVGNYYKFAAIKNLLSRKDIINNKVIDLQQYAFSDEHIEKIKEIYFEDGRYGKVYYQDVPELGLQGGPRKSLDRINYLGLEKIDFKDKVVWDIGSAGGFFCRYAIDRGAKRVIGFDEEKPSHAAYILSNYLGYFNIDFETVDLRKGIPNNYPKPDVVLFLSMNYHVPIPAQIFQAEAVVFEDNGKETRQLDSLKEPWSIEFKTINFIGRAIDHGDKAIYHLFK